jgi:hypothetical protein
MKLFKFVVCSLLAVGSGQNTTGDSKNTDALKALAGLSPDQITALLGI